MALARRLPHLAALTAAVVALPTLAATPAPTAEEGVHSESMRHVANIEYPAIHGFGGNYGTDSAFAELQVDGEVHPFVLAGSIQSGLHLVDIADPEAPVVVSVYDCVIGQGDVQTFTREDRTYATFTDDGYARSMESACVEWAQDNASEAFFGAGGQGTYVVDVTDPREPQTVAFVPFPKGSHNQTVHPSGNFLYNSNSELITNAPSAAIEIWDISDLANPVHVQDFPLPPTPGLGTDSHDITFSADGTRAYSAALSKTVILDTTDPASPALVSAIIDPAINVEHQSDPITLTDPVTGETRDYLVIEDEFAGAVGAEPACPSGGVHVYDVTGDLELAPVKVGVWNTADVIPNTKPLTSCTAHVFQLVPEAGVMLISYYQLGVRVVDISGLMGVSLGEYGAVGMREVGFYRFDDSDSWSFKTNAVAEDGSFYGYSNDISRGLDVFHFDPSKVSPVLQGTDEWLSPQEALQRAFANPADLTGYTPFCLLRPDTATA